MIWCDLDNTLIWTWDPLITSPLLSVVFNQPIENRPPRGKNWRRLTRIEVPELGVGYACARKSVQPFLRELRKLDHVILLTNAIRPYAQAMDATFELGFGGDIVSRERLSERTAADPTGVLVDNSSEFETDMQHHAARSRKLRYLGITRDRVVEVPYFRGRVEDEFEEKWRTYLTQVAAALKR